jgi:lysophosphatidylcholine acyltransferase/lyso-PAF acetyltransferase
VKFFVKKLAAVYMICSGFGVIDTKVVQYSTYDPAYVQSPQDRDALPSIIVSNHQSWYDTIYYVSEYMPSFLSKANVGKYPVFGPITTALKSIYVNRDNRAEKDDVLHQINER